MLGELYSELVCVCIFKSLIKDSQNEFSEFLIHVPLKTKLAKGWQNLAIVKFTKKKKFDE